MTPPDKCPKCWADVIRFDQGLKVTTYTCDSFITEAGAFRQSSWCDDRVLYQREHERAEKWKACADGLAWDFVQYLGDAYSPNKATFDALMKEEQK
jgi:hypothetical protein